MHNYKFSKYHRRKYMLSAKFKMPIDVLRLWSYYRLVLMRAWLINYLYV